MNRRMTVICAASLLGGCATFEDFDAARHPSINSVRGGAVSIDGRPVSANFNGLLEAIGKDRQLLLDKGKIWDRSETAFGIAVLASAAYGGFNTTYGGTNRKDAAFAAASLASLRGFTAPGGRRDAYYKAGAAMNCLYSAASVFADDPPAILNVTRSGNNNVTGFSYSESAADSASPANAALWTQRASMNDALAEIVVILNNDTKPLNPNENYTGTMANNFADLKIAQERQHSQARTAIVELMGVTFTEQEIFADRFNIVGSGYLTIMTRLFNETRTSIDA